MHSAPKPFIIPFFIPHWGCPHQCIFCNQKIITGTKAKASDANFSNAVGEFLKFKRPSRQHVEVAFYGGNFLGLPESRILWFLREAAPFIDSGKINAIRFSTRPDTISNETLNLIKSYPVSTIELGVQSMSDAVLEKSNRGHTAHDTVFATALLKQKGYKVGLQMMTGLPGDTLEGSLETARKIIALDPDFVRIYPTLVLKGSPLADIYNKENYAPQSIEECVSVLKSLYMMFADRHIPVIRMGLQASEELSDKSVVLAGPYHPALGHLVLSSLMLDYAVAKIKGHNIQDHSVTLTVHPKSISRMQGLNKENITAMKKIFGLKVIKLRAENFLEENEVRVSD